MKYALIGVALIAGCASQPAGYWTGPGSEQQFRAAEAQCLAQAGPVAQAAPGTQITSYNAAGNAFATNYSAASNAVAANQSNQLRQRIYLGCMAGKGYHWVQG